MDYLGYWSLPQKPFAHDASRRFFSGCPQREFIAGLNYLLIRDQRSAVLVSPAGCGTTSLLRRAARTCGIGDCAVEMLVTRGDQASAQRILADLSAALGLPSLSENPSDRIRATIAATARQSVRTVWLVDRCQLPAARVACELSASIPRFSVVLAVGLNHADRFTTMLAREPLATAPMRMELEALSLPDTVDYVRQSLHQAGGSSDCWSDAAIVRLHEIGQGRLAKMSTVAESAMVLAARHQMDAVGPETVEAAEERIAHAA